MSNRPMNLSYHSRRVLGSIVYATDGTHSKNGKQLDLFDKKYAAVLVRRGLVWWFEACGIRVYKATDKGIAAWDEALRQANDAAQ